jgi:hypothetical protein
MPRSIARDCPRNGPPPQLGTDKQQGPRAHKNPEFRATFHPAARLMNWGWCIPTCCFPGAFLDHGCRGAGRFWLTYMKFASNRITPCGIKRNMEAFTDECTF